MNTLEIALDILQQPTEKEAHSRLNQYFVALSKEEFAQMRQLITLFFK